MSERHLNDTKNFNTFNREIQEAIGDEATENLIQFAKLRYQQTFHLYPNSCFLVIKGHEREIHLDLMSFQNL